MKELIKRILRESLLTESFQDIEYHVTSIYNLANIIKDNEIRLSNWVFSSSVSDRFGKKFFYLSLSRTASLDLSFGTGADDFGRIVFDGKKLGYNFKSMPVDYFTGGKHRPKMIRDRNAYEYEDRLLSDKPTLENVIKYIKWVEVLISGDAYNVRVFKYLIKICKERGVELRAYRTKSDMTKDRNRIDLSEYEMDDKFEFKLDRSIYLEKKILIYVLALLMYDEKYLNDYTTFANELINFLKKNKLDGIFKELYIDYNDVFEKIINIGRVNLSDEIKSAITSTTPYQYNMIKKPISLLVREIRKSGASDLDSFIRMKLTNIKDRFVDYADNWNFYVLDDDDGLWFQLDNEAPFDEDEFVGMSPDKNDYNLFIKYKGIGRTLGDWVNFLTNKYGLKFMEEFYDDKLHNGKRYKFMSDN